jgi:hypothetical protein
MARCPPPSTSGGFLNHCPTTFAPTTQSNDSKPQSRFRVLRRLLGRPSQKSEERRDDTTYMSGAASGLPCKPKGTFSSYTQLPGQPGKRPVLTRQQTPVGRRRRTVESHGVQENPGSASEESLGRHPSNGASPSDSISGGPTGRSAGAEGNGPSDSDARSYGGLWKHGKDGTWWFSARPGRDRTQAGPFTGPFELRCNDNSYGFDIFCRPLDPDGRLQTSSAEYQEKLNWEFETCYVFGEDGSRCWAKDNSGWHLVNDPRFQTDPPRASAAGSSGGASPGPDEDTHPSTHTGASRASPASRDTEVPEDSSPSGSHGGPASTSRPGFDGPPLPAVPETVDTAATTGPGGGAVTAPVTASSQPPATTPPGAWINFTVPEIRPPGQPPAGDTTNFSSQGDGRAPEAQRGASVSPSHQEPELHEDDGMSERGDHSQDPEDQVTSNPGSQAGAVPPDPIPPGAYPAGSNAPTRTAPRKSKPKRRAQSANTSPLLKVYNSLRNTAGAVTSTFVSAVPPLIRGGTQLANSIWDTE